MLAVRTKRKYNEVFKENVTPSKKKTMDIPFSFTNPKYENELRRQAMLKKNAPTKTVKVLGRCENRMPATKKQASITKYYSSKPKKSSVPVKIFDENALPQNQSTPTKENNEKKDVKTSEEPSAFSMLCMKEAPEKYWEMLAEERRKALEMALNENKQLAEEIDEKDKTIHELEEEVVELKETATHAEYLASVLEEIGKDVGLDLSDIKKNEEDDEKDSDSDDSSLADELEKSPPEENCEKDEEETKDCVEDLNEKLSTAQSQNEVEDSECNKQNEVETECNTETSAEKGSESSAESGDKPDIETNINEEAISIEKNEEYVSKNENKPCCSSIFE